MNTYETKAWRDYIAGREYNRRIGLYRTARENERFYRGDQWSDREDGLPHPVFNLVRRIVDYLVAAVSAGRTSVFYEADPVPTDRKETGAERERALRVLGEEARALWKRSEMDRKLPELLLDAALAGDAVCYCRWNPEAGGTGPFAGDVETVMLHGSDLFVADVSDPELSAQDWVMLAGRDSVEHLRREAREAGFDEKDVARILPDGVEPSDGPSELGAMLPADRYATFLIRFWREDGRVVFRKSTRALDFPAVVTRERRYPVALFRWNGARDSYHGSSPVTAILPNQRYLNLAYALAMKHMRDTAFSKVVYDQSRIPEWSNEVGEAIAAVGGGNIADVATVLGTGQMQAGYLDLIERVERVTKEMTGATDTVLGSADATNTSAILALQEASRTSLGRVSASYGAFLSEIAEIWQDLLVSCFPSGRPVMCPGGGEEYADFSVLRDCRVRAGIEVSGAGRFSGAERVSLLGHLLDGGHITPVQYLERLPEGVLPDRETLIDELRAKEGDHV